MVGDPKWWGEGDMVDINCRIRALMERLIASGLETGLQAAAYFRGELVLDAWAGVADSSSKRPVDGDTLFCTFSTTKGITATAIHLLAERGKLDYDDPIAKFWPEFAAHGKNRITIRHALTHTAGMPHMPEGVKPEDLCDWDKMCRWIADLSPLSEPGSQFMYHAMSFGWLLGEVARRADGRPIERIVQEDLCTPLGITDLYFGIPDEAEQRVALLEASPPSGPPPQLDPIWARIMPPELGPLHELVSKPDIRRAVLPGFGGIMNARSVAALYASLAGASPSGIQLLSPERIREITRLKFDDKGGIIDEPMNRPLGYALGGPLSAMGDRLSAFGHGGYGGSLGFADTCYHFSFGLAKTLLSDRLAGEDTAYLIAREIRAALGIPEKGEAV